MVQRGAVFASMRERSTPKAARHNSCAVFLPASSGFSLTAAACKRLKTSLTNTVLSGELPGSTVAVPAVKPGNVKFGIKSVEAR